MSVVTLKISWVGRMANLDVHDSSELNPTPAPPAAADRPVKEGQSHLLPQREGGREVGWLF